MYKYKSDPAKRVKTKSLLPKLRLPPWLAGPVLLLFMFSGPILAKYPLLHNLGEGTCWHGISFGTGIKVGSKHRRGHDYCKDQEKQKETPDDGKPFRYYYCQAAKPIFGFGDKYYIDRENIVRDQCDQVLYRLPENANVDFLEKLNE